MLLQSTLWDTCLEQNPPRSSASYCSGPASGRQGSLSQVQRAYRSYCALTQGIGNGSRGDQTFCVRECQVEFPNALTRFAKWLALHFCCFLTLSFCYFRGLKLSESLCFLCLASRRAFVPPAFPGAPIFWDTSQPLPDLAAFGQAFVSSASSNRATPDLVNYCLWPPSGRDKNQEEKKVATFLAELLSSPNKLSCLSIVPQLSEMMGPHQGWFERSVDAITRGPGHSFFKERFPLSQAQLPGRSCS